MATGGSIAGIGPHRLDYVLYSELGEHLTVHESLARIPEAQDVADVEGEDITSVGSTSIGPREWLMLAQRANRLMGEDPGLSGIVVTHGTATLEETAYFLHLTVKSSRPVVVTGAMRPPTSLGTDADLNLLDAIRVAACPEAQGKRRPDRAEQRNPQRPGRIQGQYLPGGDLPPQRTGFPGLHRLRRAGGVLPVAHPVPHHLHPLRRRDAGHLAPGGHRLCLWGSGRPAGGRRREHRPGGLVLAGFGGGTFPAAFQEAGARAVEDGIPVVLASRATAGRVVMTPRKE